MMVLSNNKIVSLFIFFIASFLYYSNEKLKVPAYDLLGSKFFPRIICIAIIVLSVMLFFTKEKQGEETSKNEDFQKYYYEKGVLFVISSFVYLLALNYNLSYLISTFSYLVIFIFILNEYRFKELPKIVIFSLVWTYIVYYFFQIFLQLLLP